MDASLETKKETDLNPTQLAIWERTRQFELAMANGDAHGVANCYCEDAQFMNPNASAVVGRENIEAAIAGYIQQGFTQYEVTSLKVYGNAGVVAYNQPIHWDRRVVRTLTLENPYSFGKRRKAPGKFSGIVSIPI